MATEKNINKKKMDCAIAYATRKTVQFGMMLTNPGSKEEQKALEVLLNHTRNEMHAWVQEMEGRSIDELMHMRAYDIMQAMVAIYVLEEMRDEKD